ncbi:MAG: glycosyl hydrolase family 17 protein [Candidatus Azotimanducaceae bacterium]
MRPRLDVVRGLCYSGYRNEQSPELGILPSYDEVKEDLLLLQDDWQSLRLYASDAHSQTVLEVIRDEGLTFTVMLGAYVTAEVDNPDCPWGGVYSSRQLKENQRHNDFEIAELIRLSQIFSDIVVCVSIGNEAAVSWTDHRVPTLRLIEFANRLKGQVIQPVTFCENYVPWQFELASLAEVLDIISIHSYPVWEHKSVDEGLEFTIANYQSVAMAYPDHQVIITEAGWATASNGRGIEPQQVSESAQRRYFEALMQWSEQAQVLIYYFEAFDENWKGSAHPLEPEKHWGLYRADRTPKLAMS